MAAAGIPATEKAANGTRRRLLGPPRPKDTFDVDTTRARTGLLVVFFGDLGIVAAAILGVFKVAGTGASGPVVVSILTSAFTAVGTMTTAYLGIRASSTTAEKSIATRHTAPHDSSG